MKTKIKRHSRSVLSVVLTLCMLVSCMTVGLVTTDAAKVDGGSAAVGAAADEAVAAAIDSQPAQEEGAALDTDEADDVSAANSSAVGAKSDSESVGAADVYHVKGDFSNPGDQSAWNTNYTFDATTKKVSISLAANTTYNFKIYSTYGSGKWYGANKNYTGTDSEFYFNNNNSTNATIKTTAAGDYVFTLKREDQGDNAVAIAVTYPAAAKTYTVTKAATTNGTFTVSPTTATESTTITVNAKPNRGYKLKSITATGVSTVNVNVSDNTGTFQMPSQNTTVTVVFEQATSYTIKANKVITGSGTINITLKSGNTAVAAATATTSADATLTAYSGETLVVTATPSSGYQLDTLTANGDSRSSGYWVNVIGNITDIAATFTTKTYPNQYTATLGSTITGNNDLYTKIKATYFDYKTDHEVDGSWIRSIQNQSDRGRYEGTCEPYTKLNTALKNYSNGDVDYPIYFGNFYERIDGYAGKNNSTDSNFKNIVNNSQGTALGGDHKAVTGLTGKTLSSNGLPTYYKNGETNENGKEMKLFDKDWLSDSSSSGNGQGVLANIIDAPFPVKKNGDTYIFNSNNGAQNIYFKNLPESPYYDMDTLYLNISNRPDYDGGLNSTWFAYFFEGPERSGYSENKWVQMEWNSNGVWKVPYDGDYKKVIFVRKAAGSSGSFDGVELRTEDVTIPDGDTKNLQCYLYYWDSWTADSKITTYWSAMDSVTANSAGDTSHITLDYYENTNEVYSPWYHNEGFYPFDWSHREHQAYDLGFGVAMEIKFTLGPDGCLKNGDHQVFEFSGDDDLWVYIDDQLILDLGGDHKMTQGKIDFADKTILDTTTKAVQDGVTRNANGFTLANKAVHTMKLFYLERGMFDSNLKFSFSMYPYDNTYDVEKKADLSELNAGLQDQFSDSFTFKNTAGDGKGASAAYTVYNSTSHAAVRTDTTSGSREFTIKNGQYASFTNIFTVNENLSTLESPSGVYQYSTSYQVVDVENNNALVKAGDIKAGDNLDTGDFNFLTTLAGADPALDITHLRAIFTNKLKTQSFMVTKDINGYDDASTAFPFYVKIKMTPAGKDEVLFDTTRLVYKTSLDGYSAPHYLGAGGLGQIHEGEYILFDGIPEGAKVTVYEPTADTTNRTPNAEGDANCYKNVTIQNTNEANQPQRNPRNGTIDQYTDVTIHIVGFDTITIFNEPKKYRMDYQLPTRLYGEKIYKLTGLITPAMAAQGYVEIDNNDHTAFLTRKFVSDHIPRESIFMKDVIWKSADTDFNRSMTGFDDYVYLKAKDQAQTLNVKVDRDGDGSYETTVSDLTCGQSILDKGAYITGTNGTPSYWEIYSADNENKVVTRCYSAELNYVAYDNYNIRAFYGQGSGYDLYDNDISAKVNNLGVTRSHWNDTVSGKDDRNTYTEIEGHETVVTKTYNYNKADTEYDRLYLDIELAFESHGKMINTYPASDVKVGYEICILNDNGTVNKVYKDVVLNNTSLNNKNRIHAYYGFKNTEVNRGQNLGIQAYIITEGTTTYSVIMPFELNTEGSKGLSSEYDDTPVAP